MSRNGSSTFPFWIMLVVALMLLTDTDRSSVRLTPSSTTAMVGERVALTAEVRPTRATGTVKFSAGDLELGDAEVGKDGKAVFETDCLPSGNNQISARYSGNKDYDASISNVIFVKINDENPSP